MNILDRYIARVIITGAALALLVLGALDTFLAVMREFEHAGKGGYGYVGVIIYVLLTLPGRLYDLFPAAVLVGGLIGMGALAGGSELVAMRAAGVSIMRIIGAAAQAGLVLMLALILVGEFVVPVSEQYGQEFRWQKLNMQVAQSGKRGFWAREGSYYINVGTVYPDSRLRDLSIYELDESGAMASITHAKSALQAGGSWELRGVRRTLFGGGPVSNQILDVEYREALLDTALLSVLSVKPETMSIRDLHSYAEYLLNNKLDASSYWLAFWLKITTPLSCVVMMLIVMPFVFGSLRSVNTGQLLVIGILLGLGFYILLQVVSRVGEIYQFPPLLSAVLPVLFFTVIGLFGLRKIR
ncbi:MAG TPA: LPS export ABC transporter permease LptG [Gammaproteobacteria bacterium]|nr:LPS export ABC transporter permease LptG [Gammaproteobacteria bacterium]